MESLEINVVRGDNIIGNFIVILPYLSFTTVTCDPTHLLRAPPSHCDIKHTCCHTHFGHFMNIWYKRGPHTKSLNNLHILTT